MDFNNWDREIEDHSSSKIKLYNNIRLTHSEILWRTAKNELILSYEAIKENEEKNDKHYVLEALQHSKMGLELEPNSFECMKWYCASAGRATAFVSSNDRIRLGIQIKENLDRAMSLEPNDPMLYFISGRWSYEVAGLSAVERNYAKIFGSSLKSSYSEAMLAFKKADKLKPNWKINYLWMAKVLVAQEEFSEAADMITKALALQTLSEEDFVAYKELNEPLKLKEIKTCH